MKADLMIDNRKEWILQDFSAIQILREINFRSSKSSKIVIFAIFWDSDF